MLNKPTPHRRERRLRLTAVGVLLSLGIVAINLPPAHAQADDPSADAESHTDVQPAPASDEDATPDFPDEPDDGTEAAPPSDPPADEAADPPPAATIAKLFWASWHRDLGKLAMDVLGPEAEVAEGAPYDLSLLQRMFLFTRSDTIYAGSNQIQRNIISERVLGLPKSK